MLTYISVDETLMVWCAVSAAIGFLCGVVANGLRKGPDGETYVAPSPRDHYDYGKQEVPGA